MFDTLSVASEMVRTHARMLQQGEPVTVVSLLLSVRRCPVCAGPLLIGEVSARCACCREWVVKP